jgi:hypothetical protein
MSTERQERIAKRRKDTPRIHRANYDEAVSGRSRKAAIKAFCLECVGWEKEEVRLCTGLACPLYPYRPYHKSKRNESGTNGGNQDGSNEADYRTGFAAGRKNSRRTGNIKGNDQWKR